MPKHYYWDNAAHPLKLSGATYRFEPVSRIGGSVQGVIAIADADAATFSAQAAHLGVVEISPETYAEELAKKKEVGPMRRIRSMNASLSPLSRGTVPAANAGAAGGISPAVPMRGNGGVVTTPEGVKAAQAEKEQNGALPSAETVFSEGRITKNPDTGGMMVKPPTRGKRSKANAA